MRENTLIQLYITDDCNSRCKTCHMWTKSADDLGWVTELHPHMMIENIMLDYPDADYVIGGGEPILYRQIDKLLAWLQEHKIKYTLLSNCIEHEKLFEYAVKYQIPSITISYDGLWHDTIRGVPGNRAKIESFITMIRSMAPHGYKPNIKLSYTLSKYNQHNVDADMAHIKNILHFDKIYFCLAQEMSLLNATQEVAPDSIGSFLKYENSQMLYEKDISFLNRLLEDEPKKCDSTTSVFTVYANGDVVRCQSHMSIDIIGNVYTEEFKSIVGRISQIYCPFDTKCKLVCQRRYD